MSTWICEDFNETFTQQIRINRITSVKQFRIKVLKVGTIVSGSTFTFSLADGSNEIFSETITADFINTNLTDAGNRADLVFDVQNSFVINNNIDDRDKEYTWTFSSTGYTSTNLSRFVLCKRQSDDEFGNVYNRSSIVPGVKAFENPIFFEIFRWSKDSKE